MRRFLAAFLFSLLPLAAKAEPALVAHWVQYGPGGVAEARVAVTGDACPMADIDGARVAMQEVAAPNAAFAIRLCLTDVPKGAKSVSVMGTRRCRFLLLRPSAFSCLATRGAASRARRFRRATIPPNGRFRDSPRKPPR
jgi:hypothetical protein